MSTQQIKLGVMLLVAQILMLGMTYAFHGAMDRSAERAGIATIIEEASR